MRDGTEVLYREIQRPRQLLWWILILFPALLMWYLFIQQIIMGVPLGDNPAPDVVVIIFWVVFGIGFPVLLLGIAKLIIEVRPDGIYVRFVPFHRKYKQFLFEDIHFYERTTSSPLKRFGGLGIRINLKGETAYILNGKKGIALRLKYNTVVIGTSKPDELIKAMEAAK